MANKTSGREMEKYARAYNCPFELFWREKWEFGAIKELRFENVLILRSKDEERDREWNGIKKKGKRGNSALIPLCEILLRSESDQFRLPSLPSNAKTIILSFSKK